MAELADAGIGRTRNPIPYIEQILAEMHESGNFAPTMIPEVFTSSIIAGLDSGIGLFATLREDML